MKFFKLIKSYDYVTYPSYKELKKISLALSSSKNIIISAIIGKLASGTPISYEITKKIYFSTSELSQLTTTEVNQLIANKETWVALIIALVVYGLIRIKQKIEVLFKNDKATPEQRHELVYEFFNLIVSQLIEVKSLLKQVEERSSLSENKNNYLLLLQATYEITDLHYTLAKMKIIDKGKSGELTKESEAVLYQIGMQTYSKILSEILDSITETYDKLQAYDLDEKKEAIEKLENTLINSTVFPKCQCVKENLNVVKKHLQLIK